MILGIDIGGANTKLASSDGKVTELHYIPLWKNTPLPEALQEISGRLHPEKAGVVITGELADCFPDKDAGLSYIMDAVNNAFPDAYFLTSSGAFTKEKTRDLAAANWTASSIIVGRELGDCIFVDMGSTTTDIIPITNGAPQAGLTDFGRLKNSELVYSGILRTGIAALCNSVDIEGTRTRVSSELFAQTADAYLVLGMIPQEDYTCDTPDGAGTTIMDAKRRLARVVCADLSEIEDDAIVSIAKQAVENQRREIMDAVRDVAARHGLEMIVACGLGEFVIKQIADELGFEVVLVSDKYGKDISKVFPAYAVARLLSEK
ncbi:MAG: H4MPT-linked C1 transfer pathway protein [Candidatus Methanoperedens sp.]|jgi:hypothetical protein|nr:H4MPT-linked C1 transfer pathway protein [Candidatus Methanoperedens sp.]PKL52874.1 MAG: H4MPT-linked C1 transfer pathway protein [Candidatus Methanoperedenaceae archaeon HGW-Methanoperedenaceae-1]